MAAMAVRFRREAASMALGAALVALAAALLVSHAMEEGSSSRGGADGAGGQTCCHGEGETLTRVQGEGETHARVQGEGEGSAGASAAFSLAMDDCVGSGGWEDGAGSAFVWAMEDGDGGAGSSGDSVPVLPLEMLNGTLDEAFNRQHEKNMQWMIDVQTTFDSWVDTLDSQVEEVNAEMEGLDAVAMEDAEDVAVVMDEAEDVAVAMGEAEDVAVAMDEHVHQFDLLTAGEQVIFDVMFDIHHPNFFLDDNGVYRFRED